MQVKIEENRDRIVSILNKNNSPEESQKIADVLLFADMSGLAQQGTLKLFGTEPVQDVKRLKDPSIERESAATALINGGGCCGMLVMQMATELAMEKATTAGVAIVGTHNSFASTGMLAFYVNKIAQAGLIGIVASGAPASNAYHGAIDPIFGTNPIGFGFPTANDPLVIDLSTSALTWSDLVSAKLTNSEIPPSTAIDSSGNETRDPSEAMGGALLPFGGFKGSALALAIEVLTGPLVRAAYCTLDGDDEWGNVVMAINPSAFGEKDVILREISDLVNRVRASRTNTEEKLRIAGDRAAAARNMAEFSGYVELPEEVVHLLNTED